MQARYANANGGYGGIGLVFRKDSIDPLKNEWNKLYGNDVWTVRHSSIGDLDTVDAIVNAMRARIGRNQVRRGTVDFMASVAKEYDSVDKLASDRARLVESGTYKEDVLSAMEEAKAVARAIKSYTDSPLDDQHFLGMLLANLRENPAGLKKYLAQHFRTTDPDLASASAKKAAKGLYDAFKKYADGWANLPASYAEAKLYRNVPFSEVVAAIVPSTLSPEVAKAMDDLGIRRVEYGDGTTYLDAINSV